MGVVKHFPFREFLADRPDLCYGIGIGVIVMELTIPFLWFIKKTRWAGLAIGFAFHLLLVITLHVPTIFLFLFPPQMLLFVKPEKILKWGRFYWGHS